MYESKGQPLLPRSRFLRRLLVHALGAIALTAASLLLGIAGYSYYEGHPWHRAFLNASLLLSGIGPADLPLSLGGRLFVGFYSIYAGLVFVAAVAMILAPVAHRFLHRFHWDDEPAR